MRLSLEIAALLAATLTQASSSKGSACSKIAKFLPGEVALPGSEAYDDSSSYWSLRQAEQEPDCYVTPRSTKEVSKIVKALVEAKTKFTVKSGGHSAFAGASNTDHGVTIDLVKLNEVTVSRDRKIASIGPGNRWGDVNKVLDQQGLSVVGGRLATVGTGGLILGGGISWFSGKRGLACDNVDSYEVVLASGEVVTASSKENKDLYRALRGGGGSNFGIVTRFDLNAFDQGDFWAQILYFPDAVAQVFVPLYIDMVKNQFEKDPGAHSYLVFTKDPDSGTDVIFPYFSHLTVPPEGKVPAIFQPFQSIPNAFVNQTIVDKSYVQSLAVADVFDSRQDWWTTTVKVTSAQLFLQILDLHKKTLEKLIRDTGASYMTAFLEFQPVTANMLKPGLRNGGNSLGLLPSDTPLMTIGWLVRWRDDKFDKVVEKTAKGFIKDVEKLTKKANAYEEFKYINYASVKQDIYGSYGKENEKRLKATAKKYDPRKLLEKYWKGYHKL